jgi:hypothetical protein
MDDLERQRALELYEAKWQQFVEWVIAEGSKFLDG